MAMTGLFKIGDFGRVVTGKTPPTKKTHLYGSAYPFITPTDINASRYCEPERCLSEKGAESMHKLRVPGSSVCITCIASVGKMCMTKEPSFTNQQINSIIVDKKQHAPAFVYYMLQTQLELLKAVASGTATPIINKTLFSRLPAIAPPLPIQQKVAAILSAYDELIENNQRRIALLEKLAEEVYREWFVRFRIPGHNKMKLENRQIRSFISGYIGGGWGEDVQSPTYGNPVYVIRGTDFEKVQQGDISSVPLRYIKNSELISRKLKDGDLIVENSVNHQSRTSGKSMLVTQHVLDLFDCDVICASFCKLFRPKDPRHSKFLALNLKLLFKQGLFDYYQNIATNGIANMQAERFLDRHLIPFHEGIDLSIFELLDTSLLARAQAKLKESRDKLLPRLISGKLSVENLDIQFPPGMAEELNFKPAGISHA